MSDFVGGVDFEGLSSNTGEFLGLRKVAYGVAS